LRLAVVPRFGDARNTELGPECVPYLLLRPEYSADQAGHHPGAASRSAGASFAAVHTPHQLLAWLDAWLTDRRNANEFNRDRH
jgi:hypothetical protein